MKMEVFDDAESVAREAAEIIAADARAASLPAAAMSWLSAAATTPWVMLRVLAREESLGQGVHLFQVDERVAPAGIPDRNLTHLHESLLQHAPLLPEQIHAMPVESLDLAGRSQAVRPDPEEDQPDRRRCSTLFTSVLVPTAIRPRWCRETRYWRLWTRMSRRTGAYQGRRRMTLTYPMLNRARRVLWVVTGSEKVDMLVACATATCRFRPDGFAANRPWCWRTARQQDSWRLSTSEVDNMRVGIATDHGGFSLKEELVAHPVRQGMR